MVTKSYCIKCISLGNKSILIYNREQQLISFIKNSFVPGVDASKFRACTQKHQNPSTFYEAECSLDGRNEKVYFQDWTASNPKSLLPQWKTPTYALFALICLYFNFSDVYREISLCSWYFFFPYFWHWGVLSTLLYWKCRLPQRQPPIVQVHKALNSQNSLSVSSYMTQGIIWPRRLRASIGEKELTVQDRHTNQRCIPLDKVFQVGNPFYKLQPLV